MNKTTRNILIGIGVIFSLCGGGCCLWLASRFVKSIPWTWVIGQIITVLPWIGLVAAIFWLLIAAGVITNISNRTVKWITFTLITLGSLALLVRTYYATVVYGFGLRMIGFLIGAVILGVAAYFCSKLSTGGYDDQTDERSQDSTDY